MQKLMRSFFYCLVAMMVSFYCKGQTNTLGDKANPSSIVKKSSGHKVSPHESKRKKQLFRKPSVKHTPEYEFYQRMEAVAKEKKKMLRKMSKPQYANMLYFGHKRPPKKHLPYKMKYCKECGIRH